MRAAPAFQVSLRRFGVWHAAVLALAGIASATTLAWLIAHERPIQTAVWLVAASALAAIAALAASTVRTPPMNLRWDGQTWFVDSDGDAALQGELRVAIDLGRWLLLRFDADAASPAPVVWLPVQRRGLEPQWHALRCAVHAPRPAPGDKPTDGA